MKAKLDRAVQAARLYAGSTACHIRDAQKLYDRYRSACESVAKAAGMDPDEVMRQVGDQAAKLGAIKPTPGKDI